MEIHPYRPIPDILELENQSLKERIKILSLGFDELATKYKQLLEENIKETRNLATVPNVKFEYAVFSHQGFDCQATKNILNSYGELGWELVSSTAYVAYLKRRIFK